jgi:putative ABC transport system permease protein
VTAQFFAAEDVRPQLGRNFIDPEFAGQGTGVTMLSHRYWGDRFASDPGVIGRRIDVNGGPRTIVGVAPPTFQPENAGSLWIPKVP